MRCTKSKYLFQLGLIAISVLSAGLSNAQDAPSSPALQLDLPKPKSPDRYGLSFRMGFNISAEFNTSFGPSEPIAAPGIHGVNRTYDDGFNKVDVTGNAGGYTAYWSYQHDSQYDPTANGGLGAITMHSAAGSATSFDRDGDPQWGFEVTYNRTLGGKQRWRWGVEAAFNYMNLTIHDSQPLSASGSLTSDAYAVPNGYPPPPAPYPGDYFASAGDPLLFDTPGTRANDPLAATVTGSRRLDADVFGWRVGPYAEFELSHKVSLLASAGLSLALVTSDLSFDETFTYSVNGAPVSVAASGSSSHDDLLVGGYVSSVVNVSLTKNWGAFVGGQFQDLGHYNHTLGNSSARLDFTKSVFVTIGASFSF